MEIETKQISCNSCGVLLWIAKTHNEELCRSHETFYCPNGHTMYYPGETCEAKLERAKREIVNKQYRLDYEKRSNSALKGVITKQRKRLTNNRTQVQRIR